MNTYKDALESALIDAGYPAPRATDLAGRCTLDWGQGESAPHIRVDDTGAVSVWVARAMVAQFSLGPQSQSAVDWVALLHPLIAQPITLATGIATPVPEPASVSTRQAEIVWLDHDAEADTTYAVYTDNARIRLSNGTGLEAAAALLGTVRGYHLGIAPDTMIPMFSAYAGTVMVSRKRSVATAVRVNGQWQPALTFRDTRGFIDRATRGNAAQFRCGFTPPIIELQHQGPYDSEADAAGIAELLLQNSRRQQDREGHPVREHLT